MKDRKQANSAPLSILIDQVFSHSAGDLGIVKDHARTFARLIEEADPYIQKSTEEVCPQCVRVCCINRHSRHTHFDILYLRALGEDIPSYKTGIEDSESCQFLSPKGCRLRRFLRPYRCTWYFCDPLLEHIRNSPAREYRVFISCLERISAEREVLLNAFISVAKKHSLASDIPLHEFY